MSGALLLGVISVVLVADYLFALLFLAKANRLESDVGAAPQPDAGDPQALRRAARLFMITGPIAWFVIAALSFGLIPFDGITPITF